MKIGIWVHKRDVIANKITRYYMHQPQSSNWQDYILVMIDQVEFVQLEDARMGELEGGIDKQTKIEK